MVCVSEYFTAGMYPAHCVLTLTMKRKSNEATHYFLLQCKYIMIKELMQLLIGIINAQLLKRVHSEVFKTKDVKNTEKTC